MLRIYVDGDSMTERHRSIILRRVIGHADAICVFAADRALPDVVRAIELDKAERRRPFRDQLPPEEVRKIGSGIHMEVVGKGKDSADDYLVSVAVPGSVAITHDIPLSARLIESERSNNAIFREMGLFEGNQKRFDERTIRLFAAAFDKAVSESMRQDL